MTERSFRSLPDMFVHRISATPTRRAFHYPVGDGWEWLTWQETGDRVRAIACGLLALGVQPEQRCAIQASTRIEWILADLGISCAAGATTTVYPSTKPEDCAYILQHSETRVVFAETDEHVNSLLEHREAFPKLVKVVTFDGTPGHDGWVISLADLEDLGRKYDAEHPERYEAVIDGIKPEHLSTLIYTSGTTGKPKGVELIHDCWVFEAEAIAEQGVLSAADHQYLWLPLSHVFGKLLESVQVHVGFSTTIDGRIPKLVENLAIAKPTFMAAAPRIFEKVYNKVVTSAAEGGAAKYKIFSWAVRIGGTMSAMELKKTPPPPRVLEKMYKSIVASAAQSEAIDSKIVRRTLQIAGALSARRLDRKRPPRRLALQYAIADKLVFSKLRERFGGRIRFFISGSAPLSTEIAEFFHSAGILILEGYGLTETSAGTFLNLPGAYKFGTVGRPIGSTEIKIADDDGEILLRGRGVMRGYHKAPELTAEVLTNDGWLHTGDIGEIDSDGFLKITDRKKDLIKTSGGKYVAPQLLEGKLKALCPFISNVIVHGDRRNYCSALISLDEETISKWARDHGIPGTPANLANNERVSALIQDAIDQLNAGLASYETIKKFAILPRDLTVESGELTPSLKVKRKVVEEHYKDILDGFYKDSIRRSG